MTDIRLLNVALAFARARRRYRQAVATWRADMSDDNTAVLHRAYADMENAADALERDGLAWDTQHEGVAA